MDTNRVNFAVYSLEFQFRLKHRCEREHKRGVCDPSGPQEILLGWLSSPQGKQTALKT